jgi:hypothetical protein
MFKHIKQPEAHQHATSHVPGHKNSQIEHSAAVPAWTQVLAIQPKLTINQPGDAYEQEAETVAAQMLRMPEPRLRRASDTPSTTHTAPPSVHDTLHAPGQPLDAGVRAFLEPRFGYDFSGVRIHTNPQAAESAKAVNAHAYTVGQNVVFGAGQYQPHSSAGQKLLAHELVHVVQQGGDVLRRQDKPLIASPAGALAPLHLPEQSVTFAPSEPLNADNPKLAQLATTYKNTATNNPQAYITLKADLPESVKYDTQKAKAEAGRLREQLQATRQVLVTLGVPYNQIEIAPPGLYNFSTSGGQVEAALFSERRPLPSYSLPPAWKTPQPSPSSPASPAKGLSDLLTFSFKKGPFEVQVDLPKSVTGKLNLPLGSVYSLGFELKAEVPGDFSFGIAFNGMRYINVGLKAGLNYDKDKGLAGSAGLQITTTRKICSAANPEGLKTKILASGEKLKKALDELPKVEPDKRIEKLIEIGGSIGEMYEAVEKSKAGCKDVPAATLEFGWKGPISPSDKALQEPDPLKRPVPYFGGTLTIPF